MTCTFVDPKEQGPAAAKSRVTGKGTTAVAAGQIQRNNDRRERLEPKEQRKYLNNEEINGSQL